MSNAQASTSQPSRFSPSTDAHVHDHSEDGIDDGSSDASSDDSLLPTPHTATVSTFDVHTPGRRDSAMSSGSDLRASRSSSDSDRLVTPRRSRRKAKARAFEEAQTLAVAAVQGMPAVEMDGAIGAGDGLNAPGVTGQGNIPMPSFSRSRSTGRTPRAIQVDRAPMAGSLDVALSGADATYTAGPSTAPPAPTTTSRRVVSEPLTGLPGSPNPKGLIPGLNITLPSSTVSRTLEQPHDILPTPAEECTDVLASLVPSPRKAFLSSLHSYESRADKAKAEGSIPVTPTWGSFDAVKPVYPAPPAHALTASGVMGPPAVPSWATRTGAVPGTGGPSSRGQIAAMQASYLDPDGPSPKSGAPASFDQAPPVPAASPPVPTGANGAFSPTPNHGTHSRNLSIHFPHPGQAAVHRPSEDVGSSESAPVAVAGKSKEAFSGTAGGFAFGSTLEQNQASEGQRAGKRRGHHHKHSLSHNFFSFLDPTKTDSTLDDPSSTHPGLASSPASHGRRQSSIVSRKVSDAPLAVPMPLSDSSLTLNPHANSFSLTNSSSRSSIASVASLTGFTNTSDPMSQLLSSFALLEFLLGAALWVEGQISGYRSLAGLGYLVVFDAFGVGVGVVARGGEGWRSVRTPYGMTRFLSLLYFSQCLFLVFSAVYIAKESLEQVVLGGHEHGGHSHGHADHDEDGRAFPTVLLLCATLASALGGGVMHTHTKLVDAVGSLFLSSSYLSSPIVKRFPHLLANPFSLTVSAASALLLLAGLLVPEEALPTVDGLAALTLTILTTALSIPPTKAFGRVLLQTAPPATTTQMRAFTRAIKEIKQDRRVVGLRQTRCWAITAGSAPPDAMASVPATTAGMAGMYESPPMTPSASSTSLATLGGNGSSTRTQWYADESRDSTAPSSPVLHGPGSLHASRSAPAPAPGRPGLPSRRSSSAWHSPQRSPTVGEFGGVPSALYPSIRGEGGYQSDAHAPLVMTVMLQIKKDMGDNEVMQLTKETWGRLSKVCGGGGGRRIGEVSVGVERVD